MKRCLSVSITCIFLAAGCNPPDSGSASHKSISAEPNMTDSCSRSYKTISAEPNVTDSGSAFTSYKETPANYKKWYQGGTLHQAGALSWQESDYRNKLATCADFIAKLWQSESFKPSIQARINTVDDIRPYAVELVTCLDEALKRDPDPRANEIMYANQRVPEMAVMCMITMGWLK